eukprot:3421736-Prorocentrum_lima.AAC.1
MLTVHFPKCAVHDSIRKVMDEVEMKINLLKPDGQISADLRMGSSDEWKLTTLREAILPTNLI